MSKYLASSFALFVMVAAVAAWSWPLPAAVQPEPMLVPATPAMLFRTPIPAIETPESAYVAPRAPQPVAHHAPQPVTAEQIGWFEVFPEPDRYRALRAGWCESRLQGWPMGIEVINGVRYYFIGVLQIESSWAQKYTDAHPDENPVTQDDLHEPRVNAKVGAWILARSGWGAWPGTHDGCDGWR